MKIFVTGSTGFLGKNLVARLLAEKHYVKTLVRNPHLPTVSSKPVIGNLSNIHNWAKELKDCDIVIHCAAKVAVWGKWEEFYDTNVKSTLQLLQAAETNQVQRFIYISSEAVLQSKDDLVDIDENHPYPENPNSFYGRSKQIAEKEILKFQGKISKIILRPSFIYGSESWTVESLKKSILSGKFIWVNKGNVKVEMVYVKNVVEAIVKSLTNGKNNGIYNITDHSELTAKEFFSALMATQNITISDRSIPTVIAKPAASIIETIWRVFKINTNPPLTRFELSLLAMNRKYKTEKAIQELGYHPIYSTKQALEEMANNFQKIN